jgi:DcaP outer membrane protein
MLRTDPQGGIGASLYRPVPIPSPEEMPTDAEREKFVTRGLFPGSYLVPATNTSFKWYGFVRLDGIYDFDPIGGTDSFVTAQIPVPQGRGQNVALTPRYSRIGMDTWTPTSLWDWNVHTRIELDFFNGNNSGAFGSYPPRLRYAYADFGPFRLGQAASGFMDYDVFPNVLDYQGPDGMVLMRQVIAQATIPVSDRLHVAFAAEQPYSDIQWFQEDEFVVNPGTGVITTAGAPRNVQDMPDFTGSIRYDSDFGHVKLAGVLRKLTFQPAVGEDKNALGYGINFTGDIHPWAVLTQSDPVRKENPTALERCRILGQYAVGRGINRYLQDEDGLGLDAVADPLGNFRALYSVGWFVAYEHWWTEKWASNITYGGTFTALPDFVPEDTYRSGKYGAVNLIWLPVPKLGVGIEYLYGQREDKDGQSGVAHRLQTAVQYNF